MPSASASASPGRALLAHALVANVDLALIELVVVACPTISRFRDIFFISLAILVMVLLPGVVGMLQEGVVDGGVTDFLGGGVFGKLLVLP